MDTYAPKITNFGRIFFIFFSLNGGLTCRVCGGAESTFAGARPPDGPPRQRDDPDGHPQGPRGRVGEPPEGRPQAYPALRDGGARAVPAAAVPSPEADHARDAPGVDWEVREKRGAVLLWSRGWWLVGASVVGATPRPGPNRDHDPLLVTQYPYAKHHLKEEFIERPARKGCLSYYRPTRQLRNVHPENKHFDCEKITVYELSAMNIRAYRHEEKHITW